MSPDNNKKSEYSAFLRKSFLVLLPFLVIFLAFDVMALLAGETVSVKRVIRAQNPDGAPGAGSEGMAPVLYGRKVVDQELKKYKFFQHESRNSEVIAVGSSRILSMRGSFFEPYFTFTNTGSIAHNIGDLEDFVSRLATSTEKRYMFLSPDYYWFGKLRSAESALSKDLGMMDASVDWRAHIFSARFLFNEALRKPANISSYFGGQFKKSYGFQGRKGDGYLPDGSYLYSTWISEFRENGEYKDREQPSIIERVRSGSGSYAFDNDLDESRLETLDMVLKDLKAKNFYVIGLGLPFSTEVYFELTTNERQKGLFLKSQKRVPQIFAANGFSYFDYSDLRRLKLDDRYMFDGVHSSETAMAAILLDALKKTDRKDFEHRDEIMARLKKMINAPGTVPFELSEEAL